MPYLVDPDHLGEVTEASQVLEQFAQHGIVISIVALKPFRIEAFQGVVRSEHPKEASEKFHAFADKVLFSPSPLR
jgi:hypothetical protein